MTRLLASLVALSAVSATTCTEVSLQDIPPPRPFLDDKLSVSGALCTRPPESLIFPLRVLFVVDASESMRITDPPDPVTGETRRERAVRDVWESLLAQGIQDVRVGILRFSAQAQSRTPVDLDGDTVADSYFTIDPTQLDVATVALGQTDRTTNYAAALSEAYFEMRTELVQADLESLPLSKYVVVFLSDGIPDVDPTEGQGNGGDQILAAVEQLRELAELHRVGDFSFHTVYLSAGQGPALDQPAQDLLQRMAEAGEGSYRSVPNGEEINVIDIDFSIIRRVFTLKSLAVTNLNALMDAKQVETILQRSLELEDVLTDAQIGELFVDIDDDGKLTCGEPLIDSDGDGLADLAERLAGSDPFLPDTDDDGLGDRLEWDLSATHDPTDPGDAGCYVPNPCTPDAVDPDACACLVDLDADGLCDCTSDPNNACADDTGRDCVDVDLDGWCDCPDEDANGFCDYADTDGDGLGDCEEVYHGTVRNGVDTDADGVPDPIETRGRTSAVDRDLRGDFDFDQTDNGKELIGGTDPLCADAAFRSRLAYRYVLKTVGIDNDRTCYRFEVGNITLVSTQTNVAPEPTPPDPDAPADAPPPEPPTPVISPSGVLGNGINRILIFAGEVAFDDPDAYAAFRVACVEPRFAQPDNFKNPPSGKMRLTEDQFVDTRDFDPALHCVRP